MKNTWKLLVLLLGTGLLAASGLLIWRATAHQERKTPVEEIPRDRIYGGGDPLLGWGKVTPHLFSGLGDTLGPSNVFMVCGQSESTAAFQLIDVLRGRASTDSVPAAAGSDREESHWLAAYFGVCTGDRWLAVSAEKRGSTFRLSYREPPLTGYLTLEIATSVTLVRLGVLQPGSYSVELFNSEKQAVTLRRQVVVEGR